MTPIAKLSGLALAASCSAASVGAPSPTPSPPIATTTSATSATSATATTNAPVPPQIDPACQSALDDLARNFPLPIECVDDLLLTRPPASVTKLDVKMNGDETGGLAPLAAATALRDLSLKWQKAPDLSPLGSLAALESVTIDGPVSFSDLAKVGASWTYVRAADAIDVEALALFPHLESATVGCFEPDARIDAPTLRALGVSCNANTLDLHPLAALVQLEVLDLSGTPIMSLAPIAGLVNLTRLDVHDSPIASLAPIAKMKRLAWLDAHETMITSIAPIATLPALKFLDVGITATTTVAPLAASKSLESLWLDGSKIATVAPLAKIASLKEVMVPHACSGPGVAALHALRPDVRVMAFTEGPESKDPSCF